MRTRQEILDTLKAFKEEANSKYGVTKLGLFGSVARNQQHENSDVDVCFDGTTPTLMTIARMEIELEKRIGAPVQLTMLHNGLSKSFFKNLNRDVIYV